MHNLGVYADQKVNVKERKKGRVEKDLNPKASLEIYNGGVHHCPCSVSPRNVWGPLEQGASYV